MKIDRVVIVVLVLAALLGTIALASGMAAPSPGGSFARIEIAQNGSATSTTPATSCDAGSGGAADNANSQIVKRALDAIGKSEEVVAIRATRFTGTNITRRGSGTAMFQVERVTVFPASFYAVFQDASGATTKLVDTPSFNYEIVGKATTAIPDSVVTDLRIAVKLDPIYVAKYRSEFTCEAGEHGLIGKTDATKMKVSGQGAEESWYVDSASGRLLRTSYVSTASGQVVTDYSDWRSVGGIQVAYKRHTVTATETDDVTVGQYEVNPKIDPKLFERPAQASGTPHGSS